MRSRYKYTAPEICRQAVIFARVSSNKQELGASIDAQVETITNYCKQKDLTILVPDRFIITESSTRGERKRFHEMLDFVAKQKHKTAIVVHCIDRLQRGFDECAAIRQLLKDDKIEVHFYKEGLVLHKESSSSDIARYDFGILSAKLYIGSMQDNVKRSQKYNRECGKWQGLAPIGYLNAKDENRKATLIVDEERAPIIKQIFKAYATGQHSLKSIWLLAKEMGLMSKEKNQFKDSPYFGKLAPVSRNKVYDILTNPFYYGVMFVRIDNEMRQIHHIYPPLIDKALFDKVQKVLKSKKSQPSKEQQYGGIPFTFRGLIQCSCGCMITPEQHTRGDKQYIYLRCSHLKGSCHQGLVNENKILEQLDREIFSKVRISPTMLDLLKKNVLHTLEDEKEINANIRKKLTSDIKALENKQERLWDYFLDGNIDKGKYEFEKSKIDTQKIELQKTAEKYADITKELKENVGKAIDFVANMSYLMKNAEPVEKCELLSILLSDCVLDGNELKYKIKAPFDKLIACSDYTKWNKIPLENLDEFAVLSC